MAKPALDLGSLSVDEKLALIDELDIGLNFEDSEPAELAAWCHSELSELGARIPAIGWIPDFQHRHLG